jgi:transcriptional regulator with XRE-family HTH domain
MDSIGIKIKQFRTQNNVQQKELAIVVGISQSYLSKIESNKINPDTELLKKISRFLNTPIEKFYDIDNKANPHTINHNIHSRYSENGKYSLKTQIDELKKILQQKNDLITNYKNLVSQLNAKIEKQKKGLQ